MRLDLVAAGKASPQSLVIQQELAILAGSTLTE